MTSYHPGCDSEHGPALGHARITQRSQSNCDIDAIVQSKKRARGSDKIEDTRKEGKIHKEKDVSGSEDEFNESSDDDEDESDSESSGSSSSDTPATSSDEDEDEKQTTKRTTKEKTKKATKEKKKREKAVSESDDELS